MPWRRVDRRWLRFCEAAMLNNIHFVEGTNGETQKKYYGLADGIGVRIGGKYNFGK